MSVEKERQFNQGSALRVVEAMQSTCSSKGVPFPQSMELGQTVSGLPLQSRLSPSRLIGDETNLKGWSLLAVSAGPFLVPSALQNQWKG